LNKGKSIVVTIGVFDGVHLGHQALIRRTTAWARKLKASSLALTFRDHPMHVLRGGPFIPFLLPRKATFDLLKEKGIGKVHVLEFTRAFSRKSPEQFVQWLCRLGNLKGVVVGRNFRFGQGAKGDVRLLTELGERYGFQVRALKPVRRDGRVVSSSRIRDLLAEGKTEGANRLLGRTYFIEGEVVHGKHVGHKIGFPTANLKAIPHYLPKDGVYACRVELGGRSYRAGMNLGKRPTFRDDDHHRQAEVHLLRYCGKLYGKRMRVYLLKYLRPERKFPTPARLVAQIKKDLRAIETIPLTAPKTQ
jgi:riboflavin kinase / FMN adenylyltransferase